MNLEPLVCGARQGDVKAFVELAHGFQHLAFGSALALVHDLQQAEDVVQEALIAAWSVLPKLAEPAAFPAWLRGIVRHQAYRVLRRRHLEAAPLEEASRSRLLENAAVDEAHRALAAQVRRVLGAALWNMGDLPAGVSGPLLAERARKLQNYFTQPFFVAERYTKRPGTHVGVAEALRTCRDILEGRYDDIPESSFYFAGGIEDIRMRHGTDE
jgi:hypothetical protein